MAARKISLSNMCPNFGHNCRRGFQQFSDQTSMHGFHELYYAKSWPWRIIWTLILLVAVCVTIYQIDGAINEYLYQSSSTLIEPIDNEHVYYPPLKLCVPHWVFWMNWTAAFDMGFSKESVLYAMTILTNTYSSNYFEEDEAKETFAKDLERNNIKNVSMFFETVAYQGSHFMTYGDSTLNNTEFNDDLVLCYVVPSDHIVTAIEAQKESSEKSSGLSSKSNTLTLTTYERNYNASSDVVNPLEYNSYIAEWIQIFTFYQTDEKDFRHLTKNYTHVYIPMVFYVDGYSDNDFNIDPNVDIYYFTVKPSVHVWKSTKDKPCTVGSRSVISDKSCSFNCTAHAYAESVGCVWFSDGKYFSEKEDTNFCRNYIYFVNDSINFDENQNSTAYNSSAESEFSLYSFEEDLNKTLYSELLNDCVAVACVEGCEVWSYDVTISTKSFHSSVRTVARKDYTEIHIEYPVDGSVLAMIEIDSQTWESFIGNVGGLLGIWTGASILSLIQLFYLCCCDGMEGPPINFGWSKRPKRIHTVVLRNTLIPH